MQNETWLKDVPLEIGYFLTGFVEGEGSWNVSIRPRPDRLTQWQPTLSFNVSQREITLLVMLKRYLGCGKLRKRRDGVHYFEVLNPNAIVDRVIPFFKKFPFRSNRMQVNFRIFSEIAFMMTKGEHLNRNGIDQIIRLRENLNEGRGRKRKYELQDYLKTQQNDPQRLHAESDSVQESE